MAWYLLCSPGWSQPLRKYCLCLLSAGATCMYYQAQPEIWFLCLFFFFWLTSVEWGKIRLPANKVQVQLLKCSCCHQTLLLTPVIVRAGWHKPIILRCPEGPGWLSGLLQALHKQFGSSSCRLSDGLFWDRALSTLLLHPSVELYLPFEFYHFIRSFIQVNVLLSL